MSSLRIETNHPKIVIMASRRIHGNMKHLAGEVGRENRQKFWEAELEEGNPESRIVLAAVRHGKDVGVVNSWSPDVVTGKDALVTSERNIFIAVTFADCPPVIIFDPKTGIVAALHCGYESLYQGVIESTFEMLRKFGIRKSNTHAVIGPHIGICCYEFGLRLAQRKFGIYHEFIRERNLREDKCRLDLRGIINRQLVREGGLSQSHVSDRDAVCTFCGPQELFSARRDRTSPVEAGIIGIMMK